MRLALFMFVSGLCLGVALFDLGKALADYLDPQTGLPLFEVPNGLLDPQKGQVLPTLPTYPPSEGIPCP